MSDLHEVMAEAERLSVQSSTARALDCLYRGFNRAMKDGRFPDLDCVVAQADPCRLGLSLSVGVLSITLPADKHLPSRAGFYAKTWDLAGDLGRNQHRLLGGLEKWTPIPW